MKVFDSTCNDVYFNLATEDYLYNKFDGTDYLLLWKNADSIVLGKHQNVYEEINLKAVEESGIKIARRSTGGGTVFHDEQNLNYSFICQQQEAFTDYDRFLTPVIEALNAMEVPAAKRRTCDIAIGDKKISGSAQTLKKGRVLHHGTLLYHSDLTLLRNLLKTSDGKITSKSVKSVRSEVTNIIEHMPDQTLSVDQFKDKLLMTLFPDGMERLRLTANDIQKIQNLVDEKYSKWEWNYGQSPKFVFEKSSLLNGVDGEQHVEVQLEIVKGKIANCEIKIEGLRVTEWESAIRHLRYGYGEIRHHLEMTNQIRSVDMDRTVMCFI